LVAAVETSPKTRKLIFKLNDPQYDGLVVDYKITAYLDDDNKTRVGPLRMKTSFQLLSSLEQMQYNTPPFFKSSFDPVEPLDIDKVSEGQWAIKFPPQDDSEGDPILLSVQKDVLGSFILDFDKTQISVKPNADRAFLVDAATLGLLRIRVLLSDPKGARNFYDLTVAVIAS